MRKITLIALMALAAACAETPNQEAAEDTDKYGCSMWEKVVVDGDRVYCVDPEVFEDFGRDFDW